MRQIEVHRNVAPGPLAVFEIIAAIEHWPQVISTITAAELLTDGPIRAGTKLRVTRIMFGQRTTEALEVETFERPRRLRLLGGSRGGRYERDHIVDGLSGGSRISLIFRIRPETAVARAALDFITPIMELRLRDELESDLVDFASAATQLSTSMQAGPIR